jgi:serine phosphatase RsbU (regulator of sigma subunit)
VFPSFFTAVCLFVDLENRRLRWFNAGHVPVLMAMDSGQVLKLESTSPPLGVFSDVRLRSEKMDLPEHCRLLAFSDGVLDNYFTSPSEGLAWFSGRLNTGRSESITSILSHLGATLEPRRQAGEMDDLCVALMDLSFVKKAR